jgi:hypothetical protein
MNKKVLKFVNVQAFAVQRIQPCMLLYALLVTRGCELRSATAGTASRDINLPRCAEFKRNWCVSCVTFSCEAPGDILVQPFAPHNLVIPEWGTSIPLL